MKETITINFDGGSRGNPGPAGIGVVLAAADGTPLITKGKYVGSATNNVAEYMALTFGFREAAALGATKVVVRGDSELIIKQMRGEYRVKNPALRQLYDQAQALAHRFESVAYEHNLREHNSLADRLANLAMDRMGDVDDAGDPRPCEPTAAKLPELSCPNCGSRIEVQTPPRNAPPGSKFICPCGTPMD